MEPLSHLGGEELPVSVIGGRVYVSGLDALEARSRLDQRAVHPEVVV